MPSMHAAVDIGSNTIHMIVASCTTERLEVVADEQEPVYIGESVTATGEIPAEKLDVSISTLRRYQKLALHYGADPVLVVATEAIRRARNNTEFLTRIQHETGLPVHLIDGVTEAALSFLGATYEKDVVQDETVHFGVMDLGGGSMELIVARSEKIAECTSISIGSAWLRDRYLPSNPPTHSELITTQAFLKNYFRDIQIQSKLSKLIVVGGTARAIVPIALHSVGPSRQINRLTSDDLLRCDGILRSLTAEQISQRYGQSLKRARILPAGLIIIRLMMEYLRIEEIYVSNHNIREGILLAYKRYGEDWLDRIVKELGPCP